METKEQVEKESLEYQDTDAREKYTYVATYDPEIHSDIVSLRKQIDSLKSQKEKLLTYYEELMSDFWQFRIEHPFSVDPVLFEADVELYQIKKEYDKQYDKKYFDTRVTVEDDAIAIQRLGVLTIISIIVAIIGAVATFINTGSMFIVWRIIISFICSAIGGITAIILGEGVINHADRRKINIATKTFENNVKPLKEKASAIFKKKGRMKTNISNAIEVITKELTQATEEMNSRLQAYGLPEDYDVNNDMHYKNGCQKNMEDSQTQEGELETVTVDLKDYRSVTTSDDPVDPIDPELFIKEKVKLRRKSIGARKEEN